MSRWFRVYEDLVDDPKVQMLPDRTFRALINIWCLASRNDGKLPPIDEMAFSLRMKPDKVYGLLAELRLAGLVEDDDDGSGVTRPHNWNGRQFKSDVSNERVKRHRQRLRNVTSTVTETPPETEADTERKKAPSGPKKAPSGPKKVASRLPADWQPTPEDEAYAKSHGLSLAATRREAEKFRNHFTAKDGRDASKRDWSATWRNWVLRAVEISGGAPKTNGNGHDPPPVDWPKRIAWSQSHSGEWPESLWGSREDIPAEFRHLLNANPSR